MMKDHTKTVRMMRNKFVLFLIGVALFGVASFSYFTIPDMLSSEYVNNQVATQKVALEDFVVDPENMPFVATHVPIPEAVKAVYMSACVAATPSFRNRMVKMVEETEINSIMIDVKDYSGKVSFKIDHPLFADTLSGECPVRDMREFVDSLHQKNIFVIARITTFQDPHYTALNPNQAVQKMSDKTTWQDYKGLSFIDPGAPEAWEYIVELAKETYAAGFDELNFDYIRFPSDGNMQDIYFPYSEGVVQEDPDFGKAKVMKGFFSYLHASLASTGAVLSADLFGMTTTNYDDLNIGQVLEYAEPYFDYIAPMVYPSHYPWGFNGWANPNDHIYEVIKFSMDKGVERLIAATSSPLKLRPWLQDFDYGGNYGPAEVRAQIQATYDAGLTSWMLWDPSNKYTREALEGI